MLGFHSEIPAHVALSGSLGPLSREAPLELIAALAAAADETDAPSILPTVIRTHVTRFRERGIPPERVLIFLKGLLFEIAPDVERSEHGRTLMANVVQWTVESYYLSSTPRVLDGQLRRFHIISESGNSVYNVSHRWSDSSLHL